MTKSKQPKNFTLKDQKEFCAVSGDWNPIHHNLNAIRRTQFEGLVVHGVNQVLWALDRLASRFETKTARLQFISANFKSPILVGEEVSLSICKIDRLSYKLIIAKEAAASTVIVAKFLKNRCSKKNINAPSTELIKKRSRPSLLCASLSGSSFLTDTSKIKAFVSKQYTWLPNILSTKQIRVLMDCSYVVGMECPGENSIFLSFELNWSDDDTNAIFETTRVHKRTPLVELSVTSEKGLAGKITAFQRQPKVSQNPYKYFSTRVSSDEFLDWNVIIVGGSKGLGEVSAKVLAAGGANVTITYKEGYEDAALLEKEIGCKVVHLDVEKNAETIEWEKFSKLMYFASPKVRPERSAKDSELLLGRYRNIYLQGLQAILKSQDKELIDYFIPSTNFIDLPKAQFSAYIQAKVELENFLNEHVRENDSCTAYVPRLAPLPTDLSANFYNNDTDVTAAAMMRWLRSWSTHLRNSKKL